MEDSYASIKDSQNDSEFKIDLYTVCMLGNVKVLKDLLIRCDKSELNQRNTSGWTALMYACYHGYVNIAAELLKAGAKADILNLKGQSALTIAAARDNVDLLGLVFEKELLSKTDYNRCSALYYAIIYSCSASVRWLLEKGAKPNSIEDGQPLLMITVKTGNEALVKILLEFGADPQILNSNGESAEMLAMKSGHQNIAMLLQSHISGGQDLLNLFMSLSLEKYWPIMRKSNVDLRTFLTLTEHDLEKLGINLLGPRRKMSIAICNLNLQIISNANLKNTNSVCYQQ